MGPWPIVGVVFGIALIVAGLWAVAMSRRMLREDDVPNPAGPTRLALGVTGLFVGYHLLIWSLPGWSMVCVPLERWWIVAAVAVLGPAGSLLAEWLEKRTE
ncbi:MAG: hypothetical protein H6810_10855 [Phycisphaeraceae bacterium]|nr:MAG: hypothetical protein H6810_10855 [Phycisphaeraceae bacterium]